jgi:hypothetical protein
MTMRSLLGRREADAASEASETSGDIDTIARRFASEQRKEIRRLMRLSPRIIDLAVIFPGALYAIAAVDIAPETRRHALELVLCGAQLKEVAQVLGLPMWLRRLPPEAFTGTIPQLPQSEAFARRIVNCLPQTRAESAMWLRGVAFAAEAAHEEFAVWLAHQPLFAGETDPRRTFAVLASYAWFSGQPYKPASALIMVPWRPEISFETALCASKSWLNRIRLTLQLRPGVITDAWLTPGEHKGLVFQPLLTSEQLLEEAQAMHNCADQYADRVARDRSRLWSVRRRNGQRLATLEVAQHVREAGVLDIVQLKSRHNLPAPLEVWQAAHAWMSVQDGLRRAPPLVLPNRPLDPASWTTLMQPYRAQRNGAPWLPQTLTLATLATLDLDMAELARRAGVSSWLFT